MTDTKANLEYKAKLFQADLEGLQMCAAEVAPSLIKNSAEAKIKLRMMITLERAVESLIHSNEKNTEALIKSSDQAARTSKWLAICAIGGTIVSAIIQVVCK